MYVCMYVCMYVRMCIRTYVCMYVHLCTVYVLQAHAYLYLLAAITLPTEIN